jgi:hypothetical protein
MKQKHPYNGINQSVVGGKFQPYSGSYESGARCQFYRTVIAAVSGSLFCVGAGEHAAAQTADATTQMPGRMLAETAQSSPPAVFPGLDIERVQWPTQPLEPAGTPLYPTNTPPPTAQPPTAAPPGSSTNVGIVPSASATPPASSDTSTTLALPALPLQPTVYKNELGASADFMYGTGTITVPIGYGLAKSPLLGGSPIGREAISADRSTVYYGGTVSYSYGRSWYLDFSGEDGRSTGSTVIYIPNTLNGQIPAAFNVNDTWYQVYLRYNFQNFLANTRFRAYLRGGVSLVSATLDANNNELHVGAQVIPAGQGYSEHDTTLDVLGNFGFGLSYSLYSTFRFKAGLQLEGEGFGGDRSQDISETWGYSHFLNPAAPPLVGSTTINDTVYGAIGRLTLHAEYRLGARWKLTGDVGMMTKYSFVTYPDAGTKEELLYGPYVKVGASLVF